jgi:hypothetical protein
MVAEALLAATAMKTAPIKIVQARMTPNPQPAFIPAPLSYLNGSAGPVEAPKNAAWNRLQGGCGTSVVH